MRLYSFLKKRSFLSVTLSVLVTVLFVSVSVQAATTISSNVNTGGTLTVTGVSTLGNNVTVPADYGLDAAAAGTLNIGTTTATRIIIGSATASTTIGGLLSIPPGYSLDTTTAGALNIGTSTATSINIGATDVATTIAGNLTVPAGYSLDTGAAGALNLGTSTATSVEIADTLITTTIQGPLNVDEAVTLDSSFRTGTAGTAVTRLNAGFCNLHTGADVSIAATSTETWDCQAGTGTQSALTGVAAGDVVMVQFASTSPTTFQGLSITGASASSTQGYITLDIFNGTGAAYTWATAATSSLNYIVFDL